MIPSTDLHRLGEQLAQDFLEKQVPLTDGLQKIASQMDLNQHQIARVAEAANVETYMALLKANNGGYIRFSVAEPAQVKVAAKLDLTTSADWLSDYADAPRYEEESLEKAAQLQSNTAPTASELWKERHHLLDAHRHAVSELGTVVTDIVEGVNKLAAQKEQYYRSGMATPNEVSVVVKTAAGDAYPVLAEVLNLDPGVSSDTAVDTTTQLFKLAEKVAKKMADGAVFYLEADTLEQTVHSSSDNLVKKAGVLAGTGQVLDTVVGGTGKAIGKSLKHWWKESPNSVYAAGIGLAAYGMGKTVGSNTKGQVLQNSAYSLRTPKKSYSYGY